MLVAAAALCAVFTGVRGVQMVMASSDRLLHSSAAVLMSRRCSCISSAHLAVTAAQRLFKPSFSGRMLA